MCIQLLLKVHKYLKSCQITNLFQKCKFGAEENSEI